MGEPCLHYRVALIIRESQGKPVTMQMIETKPSSPAKDTKLVTLPGEPLCAKFCSSLPRRLNYFHLWSFARLLRVQLAPVWTGYQPQPGDVSHEPHVLVEFREKEGNQLEGLNFFQKPVQNTVAVLYYRTADKTLQRTKTVRIDESEFDPDDYDVSAANVIMEFLSNVEFRKCEVTLKGVHPAGGLVAGVRLNPNEEWSKSDPEYLLKIRSWTSGDEDSPSYSDVA